MDFETLKSLITTKLPNSQVGITDLTGTKDHLGITVISDQFEGKILIDQHQMIMDILKEKLKEEIHAVQIKTFTPEKAQKKGIQL